MILRIILYYLIATQLSVCLSIADTACKWNDYSFSTLDELPWNLVVSNGSNHVEYLLSLCRPLNSSVGGCEQNTSVCQISNNHGLSIGKYFSSFENIFTEDATKRELMLMLEGYDDCENGSKMQKMKTFIIFKCGKTLGSPTFVNSYACDTYFEWLTTAACKSPAKVNETKCYLYDTDQQMRDLDPLIKTSESYLVEMDEDDGGGQMYINVCRDLVQPTGCQGSAACLFRNSTYIPLGSVQSDSVLKLDSDGSLFISYRTTTPVASCSSPASTKVTFRCPQRGKGGNPQLISSDECQYHIEWETEFACPAAYLTSKTCQLSQQLHNIDIDLSSLATDREEAVSVKAVDSAGQQYTYSLNLCSQNLEDKGVLCGSGQGVAACQFSDLHTKSLGQLEKQTLRYSDRQLSLIYEGGDPCSSGFHRKTVINFHCNDTAGKGLPEFSGEDSCTYIFDWSTDLACVVPPLECQLTADGAKYDLSRLIRSDGSDNWHMTDAETLDRIVLNVCDDLVSSDVGSVSCRPGSAICLIKSNSVAVSLGKFKSSPTFDPETHSIKLAYEDGDECPQRGSTNSKYSANITLKCSPGGDENEPRLLRKTSSGCHFELVWFTAFACALSHRSGENCRVEDPAAGYSFDLNALNKPVDQTNAYYKVASETSEHDYYVNVCGPVSDTACSGEGDIGACQVERKDISHKHITGKANRTLHYNNGILKLVLDDGDAYHTTPPIARKTEIEFLCDTEAGIGQPRFQIEANHTYSFEWLTSFACPPLFVDCSVTDLKAKKRYDLSRLSRRNADGNWVIELTKGGVKQKVYINVCRPVIHLNLINSEPCDASSGVCLTELTGSQEKVKVPNLGRALKGPKVTSDGNLLLEYANGAVCDRHNGTRHYAVNITLVCNKELTTSGPLSINEVDDCSYSVIWETAFACPEEMTNEGSDDSTCSINDPITGHTYNLLPLLSNKAYVVNNTGRIFKLNICGPATECNKEGVSVCDDKGESFGYFTNHTIQFTDGLVELLYHGPGTPTGRRKVSLVFTCNRQLEQNSARVTLVKEEAETLLFSVETPVACLSYAVDCQAYDKNGDKYDLSPLMKTDENWVLQDSKNNKYYINICRPIIAMNSTKCPGGAIGGCQVTSIGDVVNMGYIQSHLVATEPNTLTMQYENGDVCHKGTDNESHRSTRIIFYCSSRNELPVIVQNEESCQYVIEWQTPFACPVQHAVGDECKVEDPLYHVTFDLNEMTKGGDSDYEVNEGGRQNFTLNICAPLRTHKDDGCAGNIGSCIGHGDMAISLGNYSKRLEYDDGQLKLVYVDGKETCNGKQNRTTTIVFTCNHIKRGAIGLSYLSSKSSDCSHWFQWQTSLACLPFSQADCSIIDSKGNRFNFEPLTMMDDNYEVDGSELPVGSVKYIINVCTTLVHKKGALCPPNSAACMIRSNETDPKKRYMSIGQVGEQILGFEEDHVILTYKGGDNCSNGQTSKTIIRFDCVPDAVDSEPEYVATESGCVHRFVWSSWYACIFKSTPTSSGDCTVKDPLTGHLYNLSSLRNEANFVSDAQYDHDYNLSVCQPLTNSSCGPNSGSCQTERTDDKRSFNAGDAIADIVFLNTGLLSLTYSNGSMCHRNPKPRSTTIHFICASGVGKGKPEFVGEDPDGCSYIFSWHTDLACDREIRCVAHSDEQEDYDLSSLKMDHGFYTAKTPPDATTSTYFINVCRPLGAIYRKFCPPGAAVCREDSNGTFISLGSLSTGPVYDSAAKQVVLVYSSGSLCSTNSSLRWKTRIRFICQSDQTENLPELIHVDHNSCEYQFEWKTNIVCPTSPEIVLPSGIKNCVFVDSRVNQAYNFSSLISTASNIQISSGKFAGNKYNISLCGEFKTGVCKSSAICRVDANGQVSSYGGSSSLKTVFESSAVRLSYQNGSSCSSEHQLSTGNIMMECDRRAGKDSRPILDYENECSVLFKWRTLLACQPVVRPCLTDFWGQTVNLTTLSRPTGSWNTQDSDGNKYFINLCRGVNDGPSGCGNDMAVCRQFLNGTVQPLGKVDSQSMGVNQMAATDHSKGVVVEYSYPQTSCAVHIEFVCSEDNQEPQIERVTDSCVVDIIWRTHYVCHKGSGDDHHVESTSVPDVSAHKTGSDAPSNSADKSVETGGHGSRNAVIAVVVIAAFVLVVVLLVIFRHPDRRALFAGKVKSCLWIRKSHSVVQYSALSHHELNEEDGLLSQKSGNIQHYDSDDDILL